jgi:GT2 family glycosyltransferase
VDLSVIVVSYNSAAFLPACLESLRRGARRAVHEVLVVDNASRDGTPELLRRDHPGVRLLANPDNRGFARAANQGFREARGRHLLLLNPDAELGEAAADLCVAYLDAHADAGVVGARVLNPDGSLQRACRRSVPTPMVSLFRLGGLGRLFPRHPAARAYNLEDADSGLTMDVDAVSGSFLMVRREALERAGGMDERYFLYAEDIDFCMAVKRAGYRVVYYPEAVAVHHKGASSRQARLLANREFHRSMVLFHRKHFAATLPGWANAAITAAIAVRGTAIELALRLGLRSHVGSRG